MLHGGGLLPFSCGRLYAGGPGQEQQQQLGGHAAGRAAREGQGGGKHGHHRASILLAPLPLPASLRLCVDATRY